MLVKKANVNTFILIILITCLTLSALNASASPSIVGEEWDPRVYARTVQETINMDNVWKHIVALSSGGSRFPGYEGYEKAVEYIYNYLANELGLNAFTLSYKALIPYDYNSTLTVLLPGFEKKIRVYALLPNLVQTCQTPPGGIEGKLVYVGKGEVKDFRGKDINGSIVLIHYNTKSNWMYAMNLGAKAVIFIEPRYTVRGEGDYKVLQVPIKFPRVMISRKDADFLLSLLEKKGEVRVRLEVNMFWKEVELKNVFAIIPGRAGFEKLEDIIIIATYFDAYGVVPAKTPACDEASSAAALLEFARILKKKPPYRHVLLAFFSGQPLGMAGARYFAEELFFRHWSKPLIVNGSKGMISLTGDQVKTVFVLDLSSDSPALALVTHGTFYGGFDWTRAGNVQDMESYIKYKIGGEYKVIEKKHVVEGRKLTFYERIYAIGGKEYKLYFALSGLDREGLPSQVNHIGEIFNHVNIFAVTFFTAHAARIYWETPSQTLEVVNIEHLRPQIELASSIMFVTLNDPRESTTEMLRTIMHGHSRTAPLGFAFLRGKVRYYNFSKAWYDTKWSKVLDEDDFIIVYVRMRMARMGYRHYFIVKADMNGSFEIPGLKPSGWALGAFEYEVAAFVINNRTGNIKWAPDYGFYGIKLWPYGPAFTLRSGGEASGEIPVNVILFKCGTIVLHDAIDPTTLTTPLVAKLSPLTFKLYDSLSNSELVQYGYYISVPPSPVLTSQLIALGIGDPAVGYDAIIFIPPDIPVDIVFRSIEEDIPLGIIRGLKVHEGEYVDISITALRYAEEMIKLAGERLSALRKEPALSGSIGIAVQYFEEALRSYNEGLKLLKEGEYTRAYTLMYRSWYLSRKAYSITREVYTNIVYTNVLLMVMLIPCAIIMERLLFERRGLSRIIYTIVVLLVLIVISYVLHPGLRITWNTLMASLSIVSVILTLPPLGFIITGVITVAKELRKKMIGLHFIDVSRFSITSAALSIGVGNLKKRPIRTTLTLISVLCMVISLVLFTSWVFGDYFVSTAMPVKPTYKGILVKVGQEEWSISPSLLEYLKGYFEDKAIICPRVWLRTPVRGGGVYFMTEAGELGYAKAVIGVTADEPLLRAFISKEAWRGLTFVAVISSDLAELMKLDIGDKIYVAGTRLTIVGIIPIERLSDYLMEIDGDLITPRDPFAPPGSPEKTRDSIIIIPYGLAIRIGGTISSLAILIEDDALLWKAAKDISEHLTYLAIYASDGKTSVLAKWVRGYQLMGLNQLVVPLSIMILILLNVMIASIYERIREIKIYSVLGLSPMHVSFMIFAEGFVYAILGATIGYMISLGIGYTTYLFTPEAYPVDFSSPYPAIAILISTLSIILAGIYPSIKASTFVTPSLERKWAIPTKPMGNEWYVPLPITITNEKIAYGMLSYVAEYIKGVALEERFRLDQPPRPIKGMRVGKEAFGIKLRVRLPPYDAVIVEDVEILALVDKKARKINFGVHTKLLSGKRYIWISSHRKFIDDIRKQMLLWKSIRDVDRKKYIETGMEMFGGS
ncbi:MAG: hypothetical protein DRJ51_05665 [Thermoprotei archaeon]|nr:MAG: hypothetical protein DRJ51_05665 [Thermoprotei archaeon]